MQLTHMRTSKLTSNDVITWSDYPCSVYLIAHDLRPQILYEAWALCLLQFDGKLAVWTFVNLNQSPVALPLILTGIYGQAQNQSQRDRQQRKDDVHLVGRSCFMLAPTMDRRSPVASCLSSLPHPTGGALSLGCRADGRSSACLK